MVHLARTAGLHHQAGAGAQAFAHQVLVDRGQGQQSGNRHLGRAQSAVTDDEDVVTALDLVHRLGAQRCQLGFHPFVAPIQGVGDVQGGALELALGHGFDVAQFGHVLKVQHRLTDFQAHRGIHLIDVEQIRLGSDKADQ